MSPELLIDRQAELATLGRRAGDRVGVRLVAPRRYGKTSLLLAHAAQLRETGWRTAHVDFSRVTDMTDVARRIAAAYGGLDSGWMRAHLAGLLARLGLSVGTGGANVMVGPRPALARPRGGGGRGLPAARPAQDAVGARPDLDARDLRRVPGPARRPPGPRRPAALPHPVPRGRGRLRLRGLGAVDDARAVRRARAAAVRAGRSARARAAAARRRARRPRASASAPSSSIPARRWASWRCSPTAIRSG